MGETKTNGGVPAAVGNFWISPEKEISRLSRNLASTALAAMVWAAASSVGAFAFAPAGESFIGAGKMNFAGAGFHLDCQAVFSGQTETGGEARIDGVSFVGGMLGICRSVHPLGLPWRVKPAGRDAVVISSVHVDAPWVGECEGHNVPAVFVARGVLQFGRISLPPKCVITGGALTTKPTVTIVGS